MKTLVLLAIACALPAKAEVSERLIDALIQVESGGDARAVGDGGRAYGVLQIHAATVMDVNRFAGTSYRHVDMFNPQIARFVCRKYIEHYTGSDASNEAMARCWNAGPQWKRNRASLGYWRRVRNLIGVQIRAFPRRWRRLNRRHRPCALLSHARCDLRGRDQPTPRVRWGT